MPRGIPNNPKPKSAPHNVKSAIVLLKQAVAAMPDKRASTKAELLTALALKVLMGE